jgi:NUMOD3 motif
MFYVYQYIDPRNLLPFYIGKGKGDRKYDHLLETLETTINKRKYYRIQSIRKLGLEPIVEEIKTFDIESDAYEFEEQLIKLHGRKGYDTNGILTNITIGSRPPNRKGKKLTDQQKKNMSGHKLSEEQKIKLRGRIPWNKGKENSQVPWNKGLTGLPGSPLSDETKQKLREFNLGKKKSEETKLKMSRNMKGRIPWNKDTKGLQKGSRNIACYFISPDNITYEFESFRQGCIELNLPTDKISQVKTGKRKDYKGWTVGLLNIQTT